jgi:hypothetical protein
MNSRSLTTNVPISTFRSIAAKGRIAKFVGLWVIILLCSIKTEAQNIHVGTILEKGGYTCRDIAFSLTSLIPVHHRDNQPDTLLSMLLYWQETCGAPEPMVRFRIIHQIELNTFSDQWYPDDILILLMDYREMVINQDNQPYYLDYFLNEYIPIHPKYNEFTSNLSSYLLRFTDLSPIESFFLEFYSHDFETALKRLQDGELEGSRLDSLFRQQQQPEEVRQEKITAKRSHIGGYLGIWKPNGNLSILGNHAQIGLFSGYTRNRGVLNFNINIGFINTPGEYYVVVDNALYASNNFLSVFGGVDAGFELINTHDAALITTIGIGLEGFDAFTQDEQENYGLSKVLATPNLNLGVELRIKSGDSGFFGIQSKYHIVGYRNKGGTDLSGNVVSIGIVVGFLN